MKFSGVVNIGAVQFVVCFSGGEWSLMANRYSIPIYNFGKETGEISCKIKTIINFICVGHIDNILGCCYNIQHEC